MALAIANITGTVTIALGGGEQHAVASFEVPVTVTHEGNGQVTLHAAPEHAIRQAMATALTDAANRLLADLPSAEITNDPEHTVVRCRDCGTVMASDDPNATLEHGDNGDHIYASTYGDWT